MRKVIYFILVYSTIVLSQNNNPVLLKGRISNQSNNEPIAGCIIIVKPQNITAQSDKEGLYKIKLPVGKYEITFRHIAFEKAIMDVIISDSSAEKTLDVKLKSAVFESSGVTITAARDYPSIIMQQLTNKELTKMPNVYSDVIRSVQMLAGVSTNNEMASSYNVRGGGTDENLIYLNGYEIYRPMLLRQGVEENQSLINPDMVKDLRFSNGAFSALYGDKMSSALDVEYKKNYEDKTGGNIRADLMNAGVTFQKGFENGSIILGSRAAYPKLFLSGIQTKGDYNPAFYDFQLFSTYNPTEKQSIEILGVYNYNKYDVTPKDWLGNIQTDRGLGLYGTSAIQINYSGSSYYSYHCGLIGLKYKYLILPQANINISYSQYWTKEKEDGDITSNIISYLNPNDLSTGGDSVTTRHESDHDNITLNSRQIKAGVNLQLFNNSIEFGSETKIVDLTTVKDEYYLETGNVPLQNVPVIAKNNGSYNLNSTAFIANDQINITERLTAEVGARLLLYKFTDEKLFSPRGGLTYNINENNILSFNCGVYYQPPFFNEFNGEGIDYSKLKSQKSTHYVIGWEKMGEKNSYFQMQAYYKRLYNLIPFYYDELKTVYTQGNVNEGYAYGLDLMLKKEIVKGIDSWIGYGYLDARERKMNSDDSYKKRLYDQTHTIQIYLQDRMSKHPNWQAHVRALAGSGFYYYDKKATTDPATGLTTMYVDYDKPQQFDFYARIDMGLSYERKYDNGVNLIIMAEVLNVFDKQNIGGYDYMLVFSDFKGAFNVPKLLSRRFINLKFNVSI